MSHDCKEKGHRWPRMPTYGLNQGASLREQWNCLALKIAFYAYRADGVMKESKIIIVEESGPPVFFAAILTP